jgi:hypothetical protein
VPIPLNLPNFLNAPIQKYDNSGLENLPMKLLAAYQMPKKMQNEEEERKLKNQLMEAKAKYYSEGGFPARINNPLLQGFEAEDQAAKKYGEGSERHEALKRANQESQGAQNAGEYEQSLKNAGIGYGGRNLNTAPAGVKNKAYDRMQKELSKAEAMAEATNTLSEISSLLDQNPNLYKALGPALEEALDAGGNPGVMKRMAGAISRNLGLVNPQDRIAAESISKLSNDLVSKIILAGNAGGGKIFTDMMKQILKSTKPDWTKSPETNKFIIKKLNDELAWGKVYADELRTGLTKGFDVLPNADLNKKRYNILQAQGGGNQEAAPQEAQAPAQGEVEPGVFMGRIQDPQTGNYRIVKIRKENVDAFRSKGGDLIE